MKLAERLDAARAEVAHLERQAAAATCVELGRHDWQSMGGANCGCEFVGDDGFKYPGPCSVPVNHCTRCGDCDYGENDEATGVRLECKLKRD